MAYNLVMLSVLVNSGNSSTDPVNRAGLPRALTATRRMKEPADHPKTQGPKSDQLEIGSQSIARVELISCSIGAAGLALQRVQTWKCMPANNRRWSAHRLIVTHHRPWLSSRRVST